MDIDPRRFGLSSRTRLEQAGSQTIALVIDRKSRIIMADGRKIEEKVRKIRSEAPEVRVILKTSAPICSKTAAYLSDLGVEVLPISTKSTGGA